jgi:hypothetical protein
MLVVAETAAEPLLQELVQRLLARGQRRVPGRGDPSARRSVEPQRPRDPREIPIVLSVCVSRVR